jgi:hypothetical protein
MKKFLILLLVIPMPVAAASFYPSLYGSRYCELRAMGISASESRSIAMREAWSNERTTHYVTYKGQEVSVDVLTATQYVMKNCPNSLD